MDYEWDENKSEANRQKHGYGFDIIEDFDWALAACIDIQFVDFEERELWVGPINEDLVATAITARGDKTRVISLRIASTHEVNLWKQEFYDD